MPFLINLAIRLVVAMLIQAVGYMLMAKPKTDKGKEVTDMEEPTAEAGRPIPVVFGEIEIKGLNVVHYSEKETRSRQVRA